MIPYPAHLSEPEVQARLLSCLLLLGYDARAEVRDGPSESRSGARYDMVIFQDGQARAIIEVKRDRPSYAPDIETRIADRESAQRRKYLVTNLPVFVCRGLSGVSHTLKLIQAAISLPEEFPMQKLTETLQWDKEWFMDLPMQYKLLWKYLNDKADWAGVWSLNHRVAEMHIGHPIEWENLPPSLEARIVRLDGSKWLLPEYIAFQTGNRVKSPEDLVSAKGIHSAIRKALIHHGLTIKNGITVKGYAYPMDRVKDNDNDNDNVKKKGDAGGTGRSVQNRSLKQGAKNLPADDGKIEPINAAWVESVKRSLQEEESGFEQDPAHWRKALKQIRANRADSVPLEFLEPDACSYLGHTSETLFLAARSGSVRMILNSIQDRILIGARKAFHLEFNLDVCMPKDQ